MNQCYLNIGTIKSSIKSNKYNILVIMSTEEVDDVWDDFINLPADPPEMRQICFSCE